MFQFFGIPKTFVNSSICVSVRNTLLVNLNPLMISSKYYSYLLLAGAPVSRASIGFGLHRQ